MGWSYGEEVRVEISTDEITAWIAKEGAATRGRASRCVTLAEKVPSAVLSLLLS
jgi:hypothetical protein